MAMIKDEDTGNLIYPLPTGAHLEREHGTGRVFLCHGDARILVARHAEDATAFTNEVGRAVRGE